VQQAVGVALQDFGVARHIHHLGLGDEDLPSAAVERGARLHHHVARPAIDRGMRHHLQAAHRAGAVQAQVVMTHLVGVIERLGRELRRAHHLPGEVVVAHERIKSADRAGLKH
jgi:hypothetical protein